MITLDTHAIVKDLVASGVPEKQAEVFVAKFVPKEQLGDLDERVATKADIVEVRSELKSDIIELRSELKSDIEKVNSKIDQLKTEFAYMKWIQFCILGLLLAPMVAQFIGLYVK
jgi:hypothetical protein